MIEPYERAAVDQQNALLRDALDIVLTDIDHVLQLPEHEMKTAAQQIGARVGHWIAHLDPRTHGDLTVAALVELARITYTDRNHEQ